MPISKAPYKREYKHGKGRGRETLVECDSCGRRIPRYKTFTVRRGMNIRDPVVLQQIDRRMLHMMSRTMRLCPACARFRKVSQPGKSERKKSSRLGKRHW